MVELPLGIVEWLEDDQIVIEFEESYKYGAPQRACIN